PNTCSCTLNDDSTRPGLQVVPYPAGPGYGEGGETKICIFAAVGDPNGAQDINRVSAQVFHPDNTLKKEVQLEPMAGGPFLPLIAADLEGCFEAIKGLGIDTQQLSADLAYDIDHQIHAGTAWIWWGCFTYHIHQPDGRHKVVVSAEDAYGNQASKKTNYFWVESILELAVDFTSVNFGILAPEVWASKTGNSEFTLGGDGYPTVWQRGNDPACLWIKYDAMTTPGAPAESAITEFDAALTPGNV
ncbi:unnamed protein product, partial [marine sediment metagenome]